MIEGLLLADAQDRQRAETFWDRNVVVVAGAGTGKTTILVNRILNLLMREPQPLSITEIVALTFTNKAATEMKQRLRRELSKIVDRADDPLLSLLRNRYQLSTDQLVERASIALGQLEKAQIGTLHSFAAHLLRLHPIEGGVDPLFREDDGAYFREIFRSEWRAWLGHELSSEGRHHDQWRRLLDKTDLDDLRTLAEILAGESWDLDELERQCKATVLEGALRKWVETLQGKASKVAALRAGAKQQKAEKMLAAAMQCFSLLLNHGTEGICRLSPDDRQLLGKDLGKATVGWAEEDFAEAKSVISAAQELLAVNQPYFQEMVDLLRPLLHTVQQEFLNSGWISFDGLLTRAKNLLRDHPAVRARIKGSYRAILVDEFQDTDPVQYEIILYLAERMGSSKVSWDDLELEAGKLFIVGDPKQSIYAFRRADIEAFERVVKKIIAGGGVACSLVTNFRSDASVLTVVNELFDRLFLPQALVQPANERLTARPERKQEVSKSGVQLRVVMAGDEEDEFDAAAATRAEADALARYIKEDLLTGTTIVDRERRSAPIQPGHIALIFRKLTQAQEYLDALRRYDVAYLTDGEKHFYRRQEIIDLVNILRVIDNPHDQIALVGLLRSPLGGLADQDLLELKNINGLDISDTSALRDWPHHNRAIVGRLYDRLSSLHRSAPTIPVPDVIDLIFARLPVLELAARSLHGEQAVANLLKVRDMAEEVADRPHLTLTGFVELMMDRLLEQPEEAESALAEASLDAVRILTIHKAKGLEFPIVVLPGLHQAGRAPRKGPGLHHDWSSRCYGLTAGSQRTLGSVLVDSKMAVREEAEHRRLLYVGMTRARDLLVLSGGQTHKPSGDSVFRLLSETIAMDNPSKGEDRIPVGTGQITRVIVKGGGRKRKRLPKTLPTWSAPAISPLLARQEMRKAQWERLRVTPRRLTPSLLKEDEFPSVPIQTVGKASSGVAALIGIYTHAFLEEWDFARSSPPKREEIATFCRRLVSTEPEVVTAVEEALLGIMVTFLNSNAYEQIHRARILGREVPFVMSWEEEQVMEGVIDLIYRHDDRICIVDYKTDNVTALEAPARASSYMHQASIYRAAAERCLGLSSVSFQFVFLRAGVSVNV